MADVWPSGKDFEGSGSGLIEVVSQHLPAGAEDTHGFVAEIRSSSSRLQAQSVATTLACLMT
jgi:hypothetical protein